MFKPAATVFRQQEIRGVSIPAIINNNSHFFTEFQVYEDGWVYFWGLETLDELIKQVQRGWINMTIPNHEDIKIHHLGMWTIERSQWAFDKKSFIQYVKSLIMEMNPEWKETYTYIEKNRRVRGIMKVEPEIIYKENQRTRYGYPDRVHGDWSNMFYKSGDEYWLVKVIVYANAHTCISRLETPLNISFYELEEMMRDGIILTELPKNARVNIYGLGSFNAKNGKYVVSIEDKLLELKDCMRNANKQPTSLDEARQALRDYQVSPIEANKLRLKAAYERIPEHMKRSVGNMDDKDSVVREIIYRDE
jgi:hypothetical protein